MGAGLVRQCLKAAGFLTAIAPGIALAVSQPNEEAREIESLAVNVDKTVQACGLHAGAFERTKGQILGSRGIALADEAPTSIKQLSSPSTFGTSRYHRWLDPHAEIWLIASSEKPSCRVAVSHSEWVARIGARLDELVRVGNYWRPAKEGETVLVGGEDAVSFRSVYVMDTPDQVRIRPTLLIMTAKPGAALHSGQQMIITVLMVGKI
jgi:hypothetical protein